MAAPPVTEIFYLTLKPGVELEGPFPSAKTWQSTVSTLQHLDGFQGFSYGVTIETDNLLIGMFRIFPFLSLSLCSLPISVHLAIGLPRPKDWQTLQHHKTFIQSPEYGAFLKNLSSIIEGAHLHHILPTPSPPLIISTAPVIEFATFFKIEGTFPEKAKRFLREIETPKGFYGYAYGEVVEEIEKYEEILKGGKEEGKGKAFVMLLGWESVEAHMEFRETEKFREKVGLISEGWEGREIYHVAFKTV